MNGGDRTLASYGYFGDRPAAARTSTLPPAHEKFYREPARSTTARATTCSCTPGSGSAVLAERRPRTTRCARSRPEDLLWDRSTRDLPHTLGVTVVYGHTPSRDFEVRWNQPFSIGIDTGAVYGGPLTAIRLPDETIVQAI